MDETGDVVSEAPPEFDGPFQRAHHDAYTADYEGAHGPGLCPDRQHQVRGWRDRDAEDWPVVE